MGGHSRPRRIMDRSLRRKRFRRGTDIAKITRKRSKPDTGIERVHKSREFNSKKTRDLMIARNEGFGLRGACKGLEASSPAINRRPHSLINEHLGVVLENSL
ncbi:hypothetical protein Tco_1375153 [Tanacetum coccineum]